MSLSCFLHILPIFSYRTLNLPCMQTWMVQDRLRESRYQITPWHTELSNNTSNPVSTNPPAGKALVTTVRYDSLVYTHSSITLSSFNT
jgi:hypothetical protein